MNKIIDKYKFHWTQKSFLVSTILGFLLLGGSLILNYFAGTYATRAASNSVTDIFLDNLPIMDTDGIFIYGAIIFGIFLAMLMIMEPRRMPFMTKSIALFVFVRAVFITLTHLGPIPGQVPIDPNNILRNLMFGADFFFSGHTGLPFLMALSFWENKYFRYLFLTTSFIFAVSALLGRFHYSIDIFAAFFITYSIFQISRKFFTKDYETFIKT